MASRTAWHGGAAAGGAGGGPGPRGGPALPGARAGELDRAAFEEVFPWRTGWASAVLAEGLLVPAGAGYRFAHEELGDWVQGAHLDLDAALRALVHRWHADADAGRARTGYRIRAGRAGRPHPGRPSRSSRTHFPCRATGSAR